MALQYDEIGQRLRAFRLASGLSADEVADRLGISRTALYRFEKGELAKIETLERLSELLNVSLPTLLGVGIEYIPSAVAYFERIRQLEETAEHIVVLSGPISFLLGSNNFEMALDQVLSPESIRKAGYFDPAAVAAAREKLTKPGRGLSRTSTEMGLTAVTAKQLWHHLYLGGVLCDLPVSGQWSVTSGQESPPAVRDTPAAAEAR